MRLAILFFLILSFTPFSQGQAAYTLKNGKLVEATTLPTLAVEEHFQLGLNAIESDNWKEAARQFKIVTTGFPNSSYVSDGLFYLGVADYNLEEYDIANKTFNDYLKSQNNPKYFQEAVEYKYSIAEKLASGARRRINGSKKLPKWLTGKSMAIEIYDEVIAAMPCHDIAACALYSKGSLLRCSKNYRDAVDSYQMVIKRFPKHELAPEAYLAISSVYVEQSELEFQNPDVLAFAEINYNRFKQDFPREERLCQAEEDVLTIKEYYANGLYETGLFYERKEMPWASIIYYRNAALQFPETSVAQKCQARLDCLDPQARLDCLDPKE